MIVTNLRVRYSGVRLQSRQECKVQLEITYFHKADVAVVSARMVVQIQGRSP